MPTEADSPRGTLLPQLALMLVALVWGGTFVVTKLALRDSGPLAFLALRFGAGALLLGMILAARRDWPTRLEWCAGGVLGVVVFAGYALQTYGLQTISTSKSAFITAIYVPLAPAMQSLILRKRTQGTVWLGIIACYAGLMLISIDEHFSLTFGRGERLTLGCSLAFALQIALVGRWAKVADPRRLGLVQLAVVAVLSLIFAGPLGEPSPRFTPTMLGAAIGLGVATASIAVAMNWAQRTVSPTRATIIYAMEPVWAGVVGAAIGEPLPPTMLVGSALILGGILISELSSRESNNAPLP